MTRLRRAAIYGNVVLNLALLTMLVARDTLGTALLTYAVFSVLQISAAMWLNQIGEKREM